MKQFTITIPIIPIPFSHRNSASGVRYTPAKQKQYMKDCLIFVKQALVANHVKEPLSGEVRLDVYFWMPRPGYHYNRKGEIKPQYSHAKHIVKPDRSNLLKITEDVLKGWVYVDDCQITCGWLQKDYIMIAGEQPRTVITITTPHEESNV